MKDLLQHCWESWRQHITIQGLTLSSLIACFTIISIIVISVQITNNFLQKMKHHTHFTVFLKEGSIDKEISFVLKKMKTSDLFSQVNYVSQENFLNLIKESPWSDAFSDYDISAVPHIINGVLLPKKQESYSENLEILKNELLLSEVITEVFFEKYWIFNYLKLFDFFKIFSYFLIFILFISCLFITGNSIRNALFHRKEELIIYKLMGATRFFISTPYIVESAFMNSLAALFGLGIAKAIFIFFGYFFSNSSFPWIHSGLKIVFFDEIFFIIFILSLIVGVIGSFLFLSQIRLNEKESIL